MGNGQTFKRNLVGEADVRAGLYALADEVATRLRAHGLYAAAVQVLIKNPDLKSISRQKPLPWPSHLAREIGGAALELVKANWSLDAPIRMLTVTALNLTDGREGHQLSLLEPERPRNEKRERLEQSLDAIRRKFGKTSIAPGNVIKNDIGLEDIEIEEKVVKHIVMWNLTDKDKVAENGAIMKQKLEALVGVVPGLLRAEVGVGFNGYDVALYTELEDRAALAVYADHPAHCKVKEFVHSVICERVCCDYEV